MKITEFKGIAPAMEIKVYRWTLGDCTNNGISSEHRNNRLLIVGWVDDNTKEFYPLPKKLYLPYEVNFANEEELKADNLVLLVKRVLFGQNADYLVGLQDFITGKWCMMGGNFGYSCDSRYRQNINSLPLPIHDRIED